MFHKILCKSRVKIIRRTTGGKDGGRNWIRTSEGVSQQIYSLPPLATWVSYQPLNRGRINANAPPLVNQTT